MFDIRQHDDTAPAPGDLEVVQRFMNLHEHEPGVSGDLPPSAEMVETFLRERGLLGPEEAFGEADRELALRLRSALQARVRANAGEPFADQHVAAIDEVTELAGLQPHFAPAGPVLVPSRGGPEGALGKIVAIAFHADLDGRWVDLKQCAGEDCTAVFFDRSRNRSGRWCSMSTCGNRAKVRAWRERRRADEPT